MLKKLFAKQIFIILLCFINDKYNEKKDFKNSNLNKNSDCTHIFYLPK